MPDDAVAGGDIVAFMRALSAIPICALLCSLGALSSLSGCSGASPSSASATIVGEWSTPIPNGTATEDWFFNSDDTCGLILQQNNLSVCGTSSCTYSFDGSTLSLTTTTTSGGTSTSTTYIETVAFTSGGSSATITPPCEAGTCVSQVYTRVSSDDGTKCP